MKIFVHYFPTDHNHKGFTLCKLRPDENHDSDLIQEIEAEETDLPITENWKGIGIEVGEIFSCNQVVANLIRAA